jgi:kinesin family protein 4/21/27
MSMTSKAGGGSRASDEDGRTSVRVGEFACPALPVFALYLPERATWDTDNLFSPAVRVRPPLEPTDPGYDLIPQRFQRSMVTVTSNTNLAIDAPQGRKLFVFDRVFAPDVTQEGIWEYLTDCVNSFTLGYNVSLLAYGQSGAGKSYTMGTSGPAEQGDMEVMGT